MHEPTYRDAMRTAWQIITRHKFLFVFGLFATFVGQLGILDLLLKVGLAGTEHTYLPLWGVLPTFGAVSTISIIGFTVQTWVLIAWLATIFIGFGIFLTFVSVTSHGALIHATGQYVHHPKKHIGLGDAWHAGVRHFWRLLVVICIKQGALMFLGFVTSIAVLNAITYASALDAILFITLFVLSLVVGLITSFVAVYAEGYIVLEEYPVRDALRSGWELFKEHWLVSFEIGLTVLVLNILIALVAFASLAFLFIPTLLLWMTAASVASSIILFQIGSFVAIGTFILLIATLGAALTIFTTALWMDLFWHMHKRGLTSRVLLKLRRS